MEEKKTVEFDTGIFLNVPASRENKHKAKLAALKMNISLREFVWQAINEKINLENSKNAI